MVRRGGHIDCKKKIGVSFPTVSEAAPPEHNRPNFIIL